MKYLQSVDEVVDFAHETLHEYDLGQANTHVLELGREGLHLGEVVKLHRRREVEEHVRQIWALVRQLVKDCVGD